MKVSIVIPVYNEMRTLPELLRQLNDVDIGAEKEIIVVDDASSDGSREYIASLSAKYKTVLHPRNLGKGAGIRSGAALATGDYILMHDADLEYSPLDIRQMIIKAREGYPVVYGSRFLGRSKPQGRLLYYLGNRFLSALASVLFGKKCTDVETAYKLIETQVYRSLHLRANGWHLEPEIFMKIVRRRVRVAEVPISYTPRTRKEGKKIRVSHGLSIALALIQYALGLKK